MSNATISASLFSKSEKKGKVTQKELIEMLRIRLLKAHQDWLGLNQPTKVEKFVQKKIRYRPFRDGSQAVIKSPPRFDWEMPEIRNRQRVQVEKLK